MPVIFPTAYQPSARYMSEVIQADEIVIETFETYSKQTCRNHCMIFGPNGRQTLSIPVIKANGNHTLSKDVLISTHQPWQKIHWRSIETAYNNSPFFLYYKDLLSPIYQKQFKYLLDLNTEIFQILLQILKIRLPVVKSENFENTPTERKDLRTILGTKQSQRSFNFPHYTQVFESRYGFIPDLSFLDVLFNLGPEAADYLTSIK
jgi:hypothetical protein